MCCAVDEVSIGSAVFALRERGAMTNYQEIAKVQIERGRKYSAPEPWKFDIDMEIGPERFPYQIVKTIKKDSPVNRTKVGVCLIDWGVCESVW